MVRQIKKHKLAVTFSELKGNPKWSIMMEPLWYIPFSLFSPFATIYMHSIGVSQVKIGLLISIGMFLQVFFALFSGIITDKMGRRKTTLIFDLISWTIPCLVWGFAQNFWWFLIAAIFNSLYQITSTSWTCLFTEDCPEEHVVNAFTLIYLTGMMSVFIAPLAVVLIGKYSLVPVVRYLYIFSAISMALKFILLYIYGGETKQGKIRMEETKNESIFSLFKGYKAVFVQMIKSKDTMLVLAFMAITSIANITTTNFFPLYITEDLYIADALVAVFPMIRTGIMLIFVLGMQGRLNRLSLKVSIVGGLILSIVSHIFLLVAPPKTLTMVILYIVFEAMGFAIFSPRRDALMTLFVDPKERSRIYALLNMIMIGITAPFGSIIGYMSSTNGTYPFIFNILLFGIGSLMIVKSKSIAQYESKC